MVFSNYYQNTIHDRIFWIYFIVTLFFVIIGLGSIISSNPVILTPEVNNLYIMLIIALLWLLANVSLMIIVYHASVTWSPTDHNDSLICVVDSSSCCFESNNRIWLFINILFITLLIISTLWAGELYNNDAGPLRTISGILILLGGLILSVIVIDSRINSYMNPFWISVIYLIIWFSLTLYVVITD